MLIYSKLFRDINACLHATPLHKVYFIYVGQARKESKKIYLLQHNLGGLGVITAP